jgi:hypothetical protein
MPCHPMKRRHDKRHIVPVRQPKPRLVRPMPPARKLPAQYRRS